MFKETIEKTKALLTDYLRRHKCASEAVKQAREEIKRFGLDCQHLKGTEEEIESLLNPIHYGWLFEKPPINWYATCLAIYFHRYPISISSRCRLMRAANYYGDSELVAELAYDKPLEAMQNIKTISYELDKQKAKGFKNVGDFANARKVYLDVIEKAIRDGAKDYLAYFLMLYAKLCDDYQQRQAWYFALHKIAHDRLKNIPGSDSRLKRWQEISAESLARLNFSRDPEGSEKLFSKLMKEHNKIDDGYVRMHAHYYYNRILYRINSIETNELRILEKDLNFFAETIGYAKYLHNVRAVNVRQAQLIMLSRKIEQWRRIKGITTQIPLIRDLVEGEAFVILDVVIDGANSLSDWKTAAFAAYEKAAWTRLELFDSSHIRKRKLYELIVSHLDTARLILSKPKDLLSRIYHDVLLGLSETHLEMGNLSDASHYYRVAYEHCKHLSISVEEDEKNLIKADRILDNNNEPADSVSPELRDLTKAELGNLFQEFRIDYKVLLSRMIDIGERLQLLQMEQIATTMAKSIKLSSHFRYHDLAMNLKHLKESAKELPEIFQGLEDFENQLKDWSCSEHSMFEIRKMDLKNEIRLSVKNALRFRKFRDIINLNKLGKDIIFVKFNESILLNILSNLVVNSIQCGERNGIEDINIVINIINQKGIAFLSVSDNAGDIEDFKDVIHCLNTNNPIRSKRGPEGGNGLKTTRDIIRHLSGLMINWELNEIDNMKELIVPLSTIE